MNKTKDKAWYALFTVPLLFVFTTVVIIPFVIGIYYSFVKWDGIPANPKVLVGMDNYVQLFQDERFLASAWHTIKFTVLALLAEGKQCGANVVLHAKSDRGLHSRLHLAICLYGCHEICWRENGL